MVEIFDKMMSKEILDDTLLSVAYASMKDINPDWVSINHDCSIKEFCHRICDKLEQEGKNLDEVELSVIRSKFSALKFEIVYPPEYLSLIKSLEYAKKARDKLLSYEHTTVETLDGIHETIGWIEKKILEFK